MSVLDQVFQQVLFFILVIGALLVGMNMLASTNKTTKRVYDWMFKHLVANPTKCLFRFLWREVKGFLLSMLREVEVLLKDLWRSYRGLRLYWQFVIGLVLANLALIIWVS